MLYVRKRAGSIVYPFLVAENVSIVHLMSAINTVRV